MVLQKCGRLALASSILAASVAPGCATGRQTKSVCILDFNARKCWISQDKNQYYAFEQMHELQEKCLHKDRFGINKYPNATCWFAIDSNDLTKIYQALSKK